LRSIDSFVEFEGLRRELSPFYSTIGRHSIASRAALYSVGVAFSEAA
jgi:hypothetical protein